MPPSSSPHPASGAAPANTEQNVPLTRKINRKVEEAFEALGSKIGRYPIRVLLSVVVVLAIFTVGLTSVEFEDDVFALWIRDDSRLHDERDYQDKHFGDRISRDNFVVTTLKSGHSTMGTAEVMQEWLDFSRAITQQVSVSYEGTDLYWNDVCDRIPSPFLDLPCAKITSLDCFSEGDFDFFLPSFPGVPPNLYTAKPSFVNMTQREVQHVLESSCTDWADVPAPENLVMGGVHREPTANNITAISSFQALFFTASPMTLAQRLFSVTTPTAAQTATAESVVERWEQAFVDKCAELDKSGDFSFNIEYWAQRTQEDLMKDSNSADGILIVLGYLAMIVFTSLALMRRDLLQSRILAATSGVLLVCLAVFASLGLSSWFGVTFTSVHVQVLPFLAIGLGVDDLFVMAFSFVAHLEKSPDAYVSEVSGACLREVGVSISLTSLVNIMAFSIGATMPLPALSLFSASAAVVVTVNYLVIVFGFMSVLVLDAHRIKNERLDCIPCVQLGSVRNSEGNKSTRSTSAAAKAAAAEELSFSDRVAEQYGRLITYGPVKAAVLILLVLMLTFAALGSEDLKDGMPLSDIVPSDHYSHGFLIAREDYYTDYTSSLVIGMSRDGKQVDFDYPNRIGELLAAETKVQQIKDVNPAVPIYLVSWADSFVYYVATTHPENMTAAGTPHPDAFYPLLQEWLTTDARGLSLGGNFAFNEQGRIEASRIGYFLTNLRTSEDFIDFIENSREVIDNLGLPVFGAGYVYNFYEQYVGVREDLLENLIYMMVAITCASLVFLLHPLASLIMVSVIIAIVYEVYGYMHGFGLKLNGVSVVNLILAVGVSVEFTAHIVRSFMTSQGTRDERVREALSMMGLPVLAGAVSTVLGVAANAFATFPYFQLYFFRLYLLIVMIGVINGLAVLPVVLSLIGPDPLATALRISKSRSLVMMSTRDIGKQDVELGKAKAEQGAVGSTTDSPYANASRKGEMSGVIPPAIEVSHDRMPGKAGSLHRSGSMELNSDGDVTP